MREKPSPEVKLSPLWEKALESYHEDLVADDDFRMILKTGSLEELLADDQILQPFGPQGRKALDSMNRLKPTFKLLNDFSVVLAVSFGAGTAVTAVVWGSIRMILTVSLSQWQDADLGQVLADNIAARIRRGQYFTRSLRYVGRAHPDTATTQTLRENRVDGLGDGGDPSYCLSRGHLLLCTCDPFLSEPQTL